MKSTATGENVSDRSPISAAPAVRAGKLDIEFHPAPAQEVSIAGALGGHDSRGALLCEDADALWRALLQLIPSPQEFRLIVDGHWCDELRSEPEPAARLQARPSALCLAARHRRRITSR